MFVCGGCEKQGKDEEIKYTSLPVSRARHPNAAMFVRRFHNRECLDMYLKRVLASGMEHFVTDYTGREPRQFGPGTPAALREQIGTISRPVS